MGPSSLSMTTCLFFGTEAEEAAKFYVSIFPNSAIEHINYFPDTGHDFHKSRVGSVLSVLFTLDGSKWLALNSKPDEIQANESISFQIMCDDQEEVDYYWDKLTAGGDESRQVCGWLKDKYGVHWQVVPKIVGKYMESGDKETVNKTMKAFMEMKKFVIKDIVDAVEK